jgi:hypothetical protein
MRGMKMSSHEAHKVNYHSLWLGGKLPLSAAYLIILFKIHKMANPHHRK